MVDLKGLARPEKFDGTDEHWLEWKSSFRSVMNLLDITPYLDAIERIQDKLIYKRCAPHEQYLSKLLYTVLSACFTTGRARTVFKLVGNATGCEAYRRVLLEYEPREGARYAAMLVGIMKLRWTGKLVDFANEL
eukprot:7562305-Heterocapsa_arctica.AAC.1